MLKNLPLLLLFCVFVFAGQFLHSQNLITGQPPVLTAPSLTSVAAPKQPRIIYFWAEWCGICRLMQNSINQLLPDVAILTIAERSGSDDKVQGYAQEHQLAWSVLNDPEGAIGQQFGISAVPAVFILDQTGKIVFTTVGYSSAWGLRLRLWLSQWTVFNAV